MNGGGATKKPTRKKSVNQDDFSSNLLNRMPRTRKTPQKVEDAQKIFKYIDENVIGKGSLFLGPYGRRKSKNFEVLDNKLVFAKNSGIFFYQLVLSLHNITYLMYTYQGEKVRLK
jgi:hypothetical protein